MTDYPDFSDYYRKPDYALEELARRVVEIAEFDATAWEKRAIYEEFQHTLRWDYGLTRYRMRDDTLLVVKFRVDVRTKPGKEVEVEQWLKNTGHEEAFKNGKPHPKYLRKILPELPGDLFSWKRTSIQIDIKKPRRIVVDGGTLDLTS